MNFCKLSYNEDSELLSHQKWKLKVHLRNVGIKVENIIELSSLKFSFDKKLLRYIGKVMGNTHDLGKGTKYFQIYLNDMLTKKKSNVDKTKKSHALISALTCFYQLKDINMELAIISFICIRRHHGDLKNSIEELYFEEFDIEEYKELLLDQIENMNLSQINEILKEFNLIEIDKDFIIDTLDELNECCEEYLHEINDEDNESCEFYILIKFLFSALTSADKEDAIFRKQNEIIYDIKADVVDRYKNNKFSKPITDLNIIREEIYENIISNINYLNLSKDRILSITVPTGTGKTLSCFSCALRLKERLQENMQIIYTLPYTSIIDQNYDQYKKVLKEDGEINSNKIMKHHYLTEKKYDREVDTVKGDEGRFLIESWNSQFVVTTFIQLFNCLFSGYNSENLKFNKLSNSIILLDEVQTIPYKYWHVINKYLREIAERLNIYFIFITATQPLIFNQEKGEIKELVSNNDKYFKVFKRTKLIYKGEINEDSFLEEIGRLCEDGNKNVLIILNTIKFSQAVFDHIKKMELNADMYYLSTGIVPKERKKRIDDIKDNKNRKIVVSTQMIEAGVDIDMDIVIRDLGPLDCINQGAGRANREYRGDYLGEVYICEVKDSLGKSYYSYVYDKFLMEKTKVVLNKMCNSEGFILEEDYLKMNKEYFNLVSLESSKNLSNKLLNNISKLRFKDIKEGSGKNKKEDAFRLIEEQNKVSVFIESDNEAEEVYRKWLKINKIDDIKLKAEKFEEIKAEFYSNVITVFKNKLKGTDKDKIAYISKYELENTYDENTGFKSDEDSMIII